MSKLKKVENFTKVEVEAYECNECGDCFLTEDDALKHWDLDILKMDILKMKKMKRRNKCLNPKI